MNNKPHSPAHLTTNPSAGRRAEEQDALTSALHLSMRPWWTKVSSMILLGGIALSSGARLMADNYILIGGGTYSGSQYDWAAGSNWTGGTNWPYPRSAGDTVSIGTLGANYDQGPLQILLSSGTYRVGSISVSSDGTVSAVNLKSGTNLDFGLLNSGTSVASLDAAPGIDLVVEPNIALGSNLVINGGSQSTGTITLSGVLSGDKSIDVNGGTVVLSGTNTYSGGTSVKNASVLVDPALSSSSVFGTGTLSVDGGTVDVAGTQQTIAGTFTLKGDGVLSDSLTGGSLSASSYRLESGSVAVILAGTGSLSKVTGGTVTISSANTYSGGTDVSGGSLIVTGGALGGGTLTVQGSGVVLDVANSTTLTLDPGASFILKDGATVLATGGGAISADAHDLQSGTVDAVLSGGTLNKSSGGTVVLNGANNYTGDTNVTGGTLRIGTSSAILGAGTLTVDGGTSRSAKVDINGTNQTIADLSLKNGAEISDFSSLGGGILTSGGTFRLEDGSVHVVLAGGAALTKTGTGTVSLNADNTFGGGSTLSEGTVILGGTSSALGAGAVTLQGGTSGSVTITLAAKDNSAPYVISNAITSQGAVGFGTTANQGTLQIAGQVTLDDASGAVTAHKWDVATGTDVKVVGLGLATAGANPVSFEKTGGGSVSLDTATTAGLTEFKISEGTVIVGAADALGVLAGTADGALLKLNGGTLQVDSVALNGAAPSNVDVSGSSKIVLNAPGQNSITLGTLTFSAGGKSLEVAAGASVGSAGTATLTFGETTLAQGAINTIIVSDGTSAGTTLVLNGTVSGAGSKLVKQGSGTLLLEENNTYSGGTQIDGGTVRMGQGKDRALGTGNLVINNGLLDMNGNTVDVGSTFTISSGSGGAGQAISGTISASNVFNAVIQSGTVTLNVLLTGNARLEKTGADKLVLGQANTFTGGTEVREGVLALGVDNALNTNKTIKVSGGTLDLAGHSQDAGLAEVSLNAGSVRSFVGSGTLSAGKFAVNVAPGGIVTVGDMVTLSGSAALEKDGAGTVRLEGRNTYAGGTVIRAGAVVIGDDNALGTNGVTLQGGALSGPTGGPARVVVSNSVSVASDSHVGGRIEFQDLSGSGAISVDTAGADVLLSNSNNSFSGGITAKTGAVTAAANRALGSGAVVVNGGSVTLTGTTQHVSSVTLTSGQLTGGVTAAGAINFSGGTAEAAVLNAQAGVASISGSASILGGKITAASVNMSGGALSAGGSLNGTTVNVNGGAVTNGTISGTTVALGGGNITDTSVSATTANISGSAAVSGGNVSADTINVTGGAVSAGGSLNGTTVNVNGGAVTNGTIIGTTVALGGGNITGTSVNATTANISGSAAVSGGKVSADTINVTGGAVSAGGSLNGTNAVNVSGGAVTNGTISGTAVALTGGNVTNTAVRGNSVTLGGDSTVSGGSIQSNSQIIANGPGSRTVSAAISSANGLKNEGGNLTLSGSNAGLNGLEVTGGKITLGADNALGSGSISVAALGTIDLGGNTQSVGAGKYVTIGGQFRNGVLNAGTVDVNTDAQVSNLTVNAQTGQVTLNGGVVSSSNLNAKSVSIKGGTVSGGAIVAGDAITANVAGSASVGAAITSTNGLVKDGAGSLTLSGNNAALNGLNVNSGEVVAASAGALGGGNVTVGTAGRVSLSGLSVYQTAGDTVVNGTVNGNLAMSAGRVLSGSGSVTGSVNLGGGILSPGNSPGIITVGSLSGRGTYTVQRGDGVKLLNTGSDLSHVFIEPTSDTGAAIPVASRVAGAQSLAKMQLTAGTSAASTFSGIFQGAGAAGMLANAPQFDPGTAVIRLRLVSTGVGPATSIDLVVDRSSYAEFARGASGKAFAAYLDSKLPAHYDATSDLGTTLRDLDSTLAGSDVSARLRSIDPSAAYASLYTVGIRRANAVAIPLEDHLDTLGAAMVDDSALALAVGGGNAGKAVVPGSRAHSGEHQWTAWTAGHGSRFNIDADASAGSIQSSDNGASLGLEHQIGNLRIGAVASIGQGSVNFDDPSVRVESDHWHVGGYGSVAFGPVTVDASALFGTSDDSSTRAVAGGSARGNFTSNDTQVGVGFAVNLTPKSSGWQVTPVARLKYVSYKQDGFAETGPGGLLFQTNGVSEDTLVSKLGLRVAHRKEITKNFTLGLDGAAYWVHDFNPDGRNLTLQLQGAGPGSFVGTGRSGQGNTAQLNLGVQATIADAVTVRLSGQQEMGSNRTQSTGVFAVGWSF